MKVNNLLVLFSMFSAFAELQTDMTEIAGELSGAGGIPYRCYRSFAMSVLFPGFVPHAHPVVQNFNVSSQTLLIIFSVYFLTIIFFHLLSC